MLIQHSWAIHQRTESFVSHTGNLEAPEGTDFSFQTLHQDLPGTCVWGWPWQGCSTHGLTGLAYTSHLFRTGTRKAEPEGDKLQCLFLMCSPGFAEIFAETLVLIEGKARHCWAAHPAPDFTRVHAPADVHAFQGSGNLVISLPSCCPHANPFWADVSKQPIRLWPKIQHAVIQSLTGNSFSKNRFFLGEPKS